MADDSVSAARHDLMHQIRQVLKVVRLLKSQPPAQPPAVPGGTFGVLAAIERIESGAGCHSKDLAAECALDPSTISRAVAPLVRAGLVVRTADPSDGRASVLVTTPHGRQALSDLTDWYDTLLAGALRDWSQDDLAALSTMLQRFSDDMTAHFHSRPEGPPEGPPNSSPEGPPSGPPEPTTAPYDNLEAAR